MPEGGVYIVAIAITDNNDVIAENAFQSIHLCHDAQGFVRYHSRQSFLPQYGAYIPFHPVRLQSFR